MKAAWMTGSLLVLLAGCDCSTTSKGEPCTRTLQCRGRNICYQGRCTTRTHANLHQSGVLPRGVAETPAPPVVSGAGKIRVRQARGRNRVFAACGPGERLTGGGCSGGGSSEGSHIRSYPSKFGRDDTIGARWSCYGGGTLTAYALCADVRVSSAASQPTKNPDP